jgi:hypothetical protein
MLFVVACDTFDGDRLATKLEISQTDYYVLPGTANVIDLKALIKQSFFQPTLNYSFYINQNLNAPFYVKPYGLGLNLGFTYNF